MPTFHFDLENSGDGIPLLILGVYGLLWLYSLVLALTRDDFDPVTKLMWVVVVIFVPLFGFLFYFLFTPRLVSPPPRRKIDRGNPLAGTPWEHDPGYTSRR